MHGCMNQHTLLRKLAFCLKINVSPFAIMFSKPLQILALSKNDLAWPLLCNANVCYQCDKLMDSSGNTLCCNIFKQNAKNYTLL